MAIPSSVEWPWTPILMQRLTTTEGSKEADIVTQTSSDSAERHSQVIAPRCDVYEQQMVNGILE
ncbi:unnamed protein product [Cyberlindnera jadinii]|uniref:Uncharacterized protein n=1 Tax=Cyberlindnera jadinii (strain ATCC 18201 / CBS 1600 / BCRC 20928 / JCM 3617 / NBRC 0987 / NRRL Y-1542) TaxID=983966 RepID=A0A0H5C1D8_CYBJN|nr:unnamed protein product [Cyberlindnera jadinii]